MGVRVTPNLLLHETPDGLFTESAKAENVEIQQMNNKTIGSTRARFSIILAILF